MRIFFRSLLKKIGEVLEKAGQMLKDDELKTTPVNVVLEENVAVTEELLDEVISPKVKEKQVKHLKKKKTEIIPYPESDKPIRDVVNLMEFPFLALSKNRKNPIIYESADGTTKIKVTRHTGHFLASIYDWDIILVVAGKIQEIFNKGSDIPSRKITIPRHELLKALHKQDGKKERKDLEKSLSRLQVTGIHTTINNEDYKYTGGFGFLDSWGYLERENKREMRVIRITLSEWLYELCCAQGNLLKPSLSYFDMSSGLKKFLYRTARKHAGNNRDGWEFSIEKLFEKSGSEGSFRLFKSKIRKAVIENDIPDYSMEWREKNGKAVVIFKRSKIHELDRLAEKFDENQEKQLLINNLNESDE